MKKLCQIKSFRFIFSLFSSGGHVTNSSSTGDNISSYVDPTKMIFPIEGYSQSIDKWIPPSKEYILPIIDNAMQQRYFFALKSRYFGMDTNEQSPWNSHYISSILGIGVESARNDAIKTYLDKESVSWGENFRIHSTRWKEEVRNNTDTHIDDVYHSSGRGIVIRETLVRILPTIDPAFGNPCEAGEGYPFDTLQKSSIRPGTPVYVLTDSNDKRWKYVKSPTITGWVYSEDIAAIDEVFATEWVSLAKKNLGAFIKEPVSVHEGEQHYFTGRPGTVLPFKVKSPGSFLAAVPSRNRDGNAEIRWVSLKNSEFAPMPWEMTQSNIAALIKSMIGRPYGWGNYNFYNDCSAEIRSLLMPFGIFLPRNSFEQIQAASRIVDLSKEGTGTRIKYLIEHGKPFTTLIYIPGHIMLFIGNTVINGERVPMTYQNIWGLHSEDSKSRSIIGGSVFFPLLSSYPGNAGLMSLAGKAQFKLGFIE